MRGESGKGVRLLPNGQRSQAYLLLTHLLFWCREYSSFLFSCILILIGNKTWSMGFKPINIYHDDIWSDDHLKKQIDQDQDGSSDTLKVDILSKLGIESAYLPPIDCILKYLTPKDLSSASCVSRSWKTVIDDFPRARTRLHNYLQEIRMLRSSVGEENWPLKQAEKDDKGARSSRKAFAPRTNPELLEKTTKKIIRFTPAPKGKINSVNSTHKTPMNRGIHDSVKTSLPNSLKSKRNLKRL